MNYQKITIFMINSYFLRMATVIINLKYEKSTHRLVIRKDIPIVTQINNIIIIDNAKLIYNGIIISNTDTATNLSISNNDSIDALKCTTRSNTELINHIQGCGYNTNVFTYFEDGIAGVTFNRY